MTTTTTTDGDFVRTAEIQPQIDSTDALRYVNATLLRDDLPVVSVFYPAESDDGVTRGVAITRTWTGTRAEQDALTAWSVFDLLTLRAAHDESGDHTDDPDGVRMWADGQAAAWLEEL